MPRSSSDVVVLITGAFHGFGGIETFNRSLIHALNHIASTRDLHVRVLSLLDATQPSAVSDYAPSGRLHFRGFRGSRLQFALSACRAARSAHTVIIGHANLLPLAPLMNGSFNCLIAHGIEVWKPLPRLQRLGASRLHRILCVSAFTQREMMRLNCMDAALFRVFPNTLDPLYACAGQVTAGRTALGLPPGPMLLSVSRLQLSERYKNIEEVITSLPAVLCHLPDAFYVIIGDGPKRQHFRDLAQHLGLAAKVFLPGCVPNHLLASYYAACDLFVLPSTKEGFGIVFLEAMGHAKPCIGARAGGIPEVVRDGVTGLLVDASDLPRSLPSAILRLLSDPALARTMGERGREDLQRNFAFPHFHDRLRQLLYPADAIASPEPLCAASKLA
ncbi:MAG TPA: glycosyltransferase family 4 protein [Terriglobales bacterium]|nr:glycosyltransferase family 4 protein [Terriglobales bacterium]